MLTVVVLLVNAVIAFDSVVTQQDSINRVRQAEIVVNVDIFRFVSIHLTVTTLGTEALGYLLFSSNVRTIKVFFINSSLFSIVSMITCTSWAANETLVLWASLSRFGV